MMESLKASFKTETYYGTIKVFSSKFSVKGFFLGFTYEILHASMLRNRYISNSRSHTNSASSRQAVIAAHSSLL